MTELDQKLKKFLVEHCLEERDGYHQTTYAFDDDYKCTINVLQFNDDYDDEFDEDESNGEEYILDYEVKICCENSFEVVAITTYYTRNKEWGGLEIQKIDGQEEFVNWMDSEPQIKRWVGTE